MVWDRETGRPVHNAIVWQDTRTADARARAGRRGTARTACAATSACRCRPTSPGRRSRGCSTTSPARASARRRASSRSARSTPGCCGTSRAGADGGVHATDVTNASRTMLMDLRTLDWHEPSLELMGIPRSMLPEIRSSSEVYGEAAAHRAARASGRRDPRRPAGGAVRPDVLRARRGEEHVRHGLVPARQHGRGDRALAGLLTQRRGEGRRGRPRATCSRARSR